MPQAAPKRFDGQRASAGRDSFGPSFQIALVRERRWKTLRQENTKGDSLAPVGAMLPVVNRVK
jgi:hypothetical protein